MCVYILCKSSHQGGTIKGNVSALHSTGSDPFLFFEHILTCVKCN